MLRCFAAVEVASPAVRRALEAAQYTLKRAFGPGDPVKWVQSHQFHLTLKFLGEIEEEAAIRAGEALRTAAEETAPFMLEAAGLGAFPDVRRPSVIWCGVGQGREALVALAARVEEAMARAGFPRESRPFRPHLTLGRVRERVAVPRAVSEALDVNRSYGSWRVERLVLMRSDLLPSGPRYTVVEAVPLRES